MLETADVGDMIKRYYIYHVSETYNQQNTNVIKSITFIIMFNQS